MALDVALRFSEKSCRSL